MRKGNLLQVKVNHFDKMLEFCQNLSLWRYLLVLISYCGDISTYLNLTVEIYQLVLMARRFLIKSRLLSIWLVYQFEI